MGGDLPAILLLDDFTIMVCARDRHAAILSGVLSEIERTAARSRYLRAPLLFQLAQRDDGEVGMKVPADLNEALLTGYALNGGNVDSAMTGLAFAFARALAVQRADAGIAEDACAVPVQDGYAFNGFGLVHTHSIPSTGQRIGAVTYVSRSGLVWGLARLLHVDKVDPPIIAREEFSPGPVPKALRSMTADVLGCRCDER